MSSETVHTALYFILTLLTEFVDDRTKRIRITIFTLSVSEADFCQCQFS